MSVLVSVCIPTLNRPTYLKESLKSIYASTINFDLIEICISNNASDKEFDYSEIEQLITEISEKIKIKYLLQERRLTIDESMLVVKRMAIGEYIYFLGDDDFFLENQLHRLLKIVENDKPDLAIFNGHMVDETGSRVGNHFALPSRRYDSLKEAFFDLRDKGMFGAVLVNKEHLSEKYFLKLFGTAHAYGCFWLSLLNCEDNKKIKILIPDFPLVALRMAKKNYNHLEVYFRDILFEIAVYDRFCKTQSGIQLNLKFKKSYLRKISSVKFLTQIAASGIKLEKIKWINPEFYSEYYFRIRSAQAIADSGLYSAVRHLVRKIRGHLI